jgi:hypothetical protein
MIDLFNTQEILLDILGGYIVIALILHFVGQMCSEDWTPNKDR